MKKLFTLLTLALLVMGSAWAADSTPTYTQPSTTLDLGASDLATTLSSATWKSRNDNRQAQPYTLSDDYFTIPVNVAAYSTDNITWITQDNAKGNAASVSWKAKSPFGAYSTYFTDGNNNVIKTQTTRMVAIKVTNCTEACLYGAGNTQINVYEVTDATVAYNTLTKTGTATNSKEDIVTVKNLDARKTYIVQAVGTQSGSNSNAYALGFKRNIPVTTISAQSTTEAVVQGGSAVALSVTAAPATASNSLTYQWYSNTTASNEGGTAIDGATSASYNGYSTASAGTFYFYCVVTEMNGTDAVGTVTSDIITVTISAAAAPTISVGASATSVVPNTEVTFTATIDGVPTPTIQWYSNTAASNEGGTAIDGATEETYKPVTTATGTFYFYAVATNSVASTASSVLTLEVKEKVATPVLPNTGYFSTETKSIEITCETEGATIQYSTDGGSTWTDYTAAFTINADATIQAKAIKDGFFDSDVASATYTKFSYNKSELATLNAATTWDWTSWTETLQLTNESKVSRNDEYTYSDIADIYELTLPSGFNGNAISFLGEYPVRNKYAQNCTFKIKVAYPGIVKVTFSNTGSSNKDRFVKVTDVANEQTGIVEAVGTSQKSETFNIKAGEITITGVAGTDGANTSLRFYKIEYVPSVTKTISAAGYATFCSEYPLDFTNSDVTAYIATMEGTTVKFTKVDDVPANTGVLLKGEVGEKTFTIAASTTDVSANKFVGVLEDTEVDGGIYVLMAGTANNSGTGFYKTNTENKFTVGANTAYLPANVAGARTFIGFDFDGGETTGIEGIAAETMSNGEVYNLQGQRVVKAQKGLYIMNGKKVLVK